MDQNETWHGGRLGPGHTVLDWNPAPQTGNSPQFSPRVCCGQIAGWTKMPLGMDVDLGPDDIALDGDSAAPPPLQKGEGEHSTLPRILAHVLWPNGCMDQDATWYRDRPSRPRHIVLHGDPAPLKGAQQPPIFRPCLLWPKGWMDQDYTCYGGRSRPRPHCVRWGQAPRRKGAQQSSSFQPMFIVAKRSPISATAGLLFTCRTMGWLVGV